MDSSTDAPAEGVRNLGRLRRQVYVRDGSSTERLIMSISRPLFTAKADPLATNRLGRAHVEGTAHRRPERRLGLVEAISASLYRPALAAAPLARQTGQRTLPGLAAPPVLTRDM